MQTQSTLVVLNGHTLGAVNSEMPNMITVLEAHESKGAAFGARWDGTISLVPGDVIRPATKRDVKAFRVAPEGFAPLA